jgi:tRNA A37 threonylcarbamoyladenosine synthetase subunit TsaC/SUA5/YrdC
VTVEGFDALLINDGVLIGKESTIIDITNAAPKILRHGAVSISQIEKVLGHPI